MKVFVLVFSVFLFACSNNDNASENTDADTPVDVSSDGAYPIPESLEDIEEQSELIILAELHEEIQQGELTIPDGRTATISEVSIKEVFEGEHDEDSLLVSEPYFFNEGNLSLVGNYIPMQFDEEYILFLSNYDGETWMIDYMGFGQYNPHLDTTQVDRQDVSVYEDIQTTDFISESEEEYSLYETIRSNVLNRYQRTNE